jgi:glycerol uptake facilitator protein
MAGVFIAGPYSGAHLNPAVSLGLALAGKFAWSAVVPYIIAQMLGGFLGAVVMYAFYVDHFAATSDNPDGMLGCFCTMPAIEHKTVNFFSEFIATFLLVFLILAIGTTANTPSVGDVPAGLGAVGALPVTMVIMSLGMSLGATTGYAMNPARDLSPRLAHAILPIKGKRDSGWGYSWIPVLGPMAGACFAAAIYLIVY